MSLAGPSGRLPFSSLAGVAEDRFGGMGSFHLEGRVLHSVSLPSSSVSFADKPPKLLPEFHQGNSLSSRASCLSLKGSSQTGSPKSGVLFSDVCGSKGLGVLETYNRSISSEPLRQLFEVPYGNSSVCTAFGLSGGLDDLG